MTDTERLLDHEICLLMEIAGQAKNWRPILESQDTWLALQAKGLIDDRRRLLPAGREFYERMRIHTP